MTDKDTTVTYMGPNGVLIHPGPSGIRYEFHRRQPVVVSNEDDIAFYRAKEAKRSPFRVHPQIVLTVEPIFKEPVKDTDILRKTTKKKGKGKPKKGKKTKSEYVYQG